MYRRRACDTLAAQSSAKPVSCVPHLTVNLQKVAANGQNLGTPFGGVCKVAVKPFTGRASRGPVLGQPPPQGGLCCSAV